MKNILIDGDQTLSILKKVFHKKIRNKQENISVNVNQNSHNDSKVILIVSIQL